MPDFIVFSASANELSHNIADQLEIGFGRVSIEKSSRKEFTVKIHECVRDKDIYIIQTFGEEMNDMLMILLMMIDACKRAKAARVTAVIPFYPYGRQDKIDNDQTSIAAKLVARMLIAAGVDRIITMDLHSPQIHGFFRIPVDNLTAESELLQWIKDNIPDWQTICLVSPDANALTRASHIANLLNVELSFMHKEKKKNTKDASVVILGDVNRRPCVIIDDTDDDTAFKMCFAAEKLLEAGAKKVYAIVIHGIFSDDAISRINDSCLDAIITTNTIPQEKNILECPLIRCVDVSSILAEGIRKKH